jgi:hypothetical protein
MAEVDLSFLVCQNERIITELAGIRDELAVYNAAINAQSSSFALVITKLHPNRNQIARMNAASTSSKMRGPEAAAGDIQPRAAPGRNGINPRKCNPHGAVGPPKAADDVMRGSPCGAAFRITRSRAFARDHFIRATAAGAEAEARWR